MGDLLVLGCKALSQGVNPLSSTERRLVSGRPRLLTSRQMASSCFTAPLKSKPEICSQR
jgi:hypothetical protein